MIAMIVLPAVLLMLGAGFLAAYQVSFFNLDRRDARLAASMRGLSRARGQLAQRSLQLEEFSARLEENNLELARLNNMKSKFLSMAVHEVRTPLASIQGFGEILRRQSPDTRRAAYARNVMRAAEQIRRLMEDLTDLAVIEAGKLKMEKAPFDLASLLEDVVPAFQLAARRRGVRFSAQEPRGARMVADRLRLAQVLTNFLNNAMKFTPAGGRVDLDIVVDAAARCAFFSVKDTGPGIHASERERVFEKFYQSRFSARTDRKKGWGLGLAVAQEIVRAHGGRIGVESAGLGKGAAFWCRIPLAILLLAFAAAKPCRSQNMPVEEKARFERSLERKAESMLARLLGPDRARVTVDATLDFTRTERFEIKNVQEAPATGAVPDSEWLPGIPLSESPGFGNVKSYERRSSFPENFIKRLTVIVVLDQRVGVKSSDEAARLLTDALDIQPARGDVLSVLRAPFASAWTNFWHSPRAVGLLAEYALISLLALAALAAAAFCLLRIADAMQAMAQSRETILDQQPQDAAYAEEAARPAALTAAPLIFDVRPERVDAMLELLRGQDPENLALVAAHLPPRTREAFLDKLPQAVHGQVLLNLESPSPAELELLAQVKRELERRVNADAGGNAV